MQLCPKIIYISTSLVELQQTNLHHFTEITWSLSEFNDIAENNI